MCNTIQLKVGVHANLRHILIEKIFFFFNDFLSFLFHSKYNFVLQQYHQYIELWCAINLYRNNIGDSITLSVSYD